MQAEPAIAVAAACMPALEELRILSEDDGVTASTGTGGPASCVHGVIYAGQPDIPVVGVFLEPDRPFGVFIGEFMQALDLMNAELALALVNA